MYINEHTKILGMHVWYGMQTHALTLTHTHMYVHNVILTQNMTHTHACMHIHYTDTHQNKPTHGNHLTIRIRDNSLSRTLSRGSRFVDFKFTYNNTSLQQYYKTFSVIYLSLISMLH